MHTVVLHLSDIGRSQHEKKVAFFSKETGIVCLVGVVWSATSPSPVSRPVKTSQ